MDDHQPSRVREIGDELYALAPAAFTAARDAHIARAKAAGDRQSATALAGLKRPSIAGWLVNLVALKRPDGVADLINLGVTMRAAQGSVPAAQLRDLSAQRRRAIDDLLAQARSLAAALGAAEPTRQHLAEAEATLSAAMADDETAQLVRSGRVVKPVSYSGFGSGVGATATTTATARGRAATLGTDTLGADRLGADRLGADTVRAETTDVDAMADAVGRGTQAPADAAKAAATRAAREQAETRVAHAEEELGRAAADEREADERVKSLIAEIARLREQLAGAQRDAHAANQVRLAADRELASARRRRDRHR